MRFAHLKQPWGTLGAPWGHPLGPFKMFKTPGILLNSTKQCRTRSPESTMSQDVTRCHKEAQKDTKKIKGGTWKTRTPDDSAVMSCCPRCAKLCKPVVPIYAVLVESCDPSLVKACKSHDSEGRLQRSFSARFTTYSATGI